MATAKQKYGLLAKIDELGSMLYNATRMNELERRQFRAEFEPRQKDQLIKLAKELCTVEGTVWKHEFDAIVNDGIQTVSRLMNDFVDGPNDAERWHDSVKAAFEKLTQNIEAMPTFDDTNGVARETTSSANVTKVEPGLERRVLSAGSSNPFDGREGYETHNNTVIAISEPAIRAFDDAAAEFRNLVTQLQGENELARKREFEMVIAHVIGIAAMMEQHAVNLGLVHESKNWIQRLRSITSDVLALSGLAELIKEIFGWDI